MEAVWIALGLTLFASMGTGVGSAIAFAARRTNYRFLAISTGFSAGVMLYISFIEILTKGAESLRASYGDYWGDWVNTASFFGGMLLIGLIDNLIPEEENPHETRSEKEMAPFHDPSLSVPNFHRAAVEERGDAALETYGQTTHHRKLMRVGLFTALAIAIHNFPEGLVTFLAALRDPVLGLAVAVAIALHNIPEGISVSVPIFYATGDRKKAFAYSFFSGLTEPLGAGVAYLLLYALVGGDAGVIPSQVMGILFAGVAGIMVYISLDELLPTSRAYGRGHDSILGLVAGMLVMALSLLIMK